MNPSGLLPFDFWRGFFFNFGIHLFYFFPSSGDVYDTMIRYMT